jgi:hypothetical protein
MKYIKTFEQYAVVAGPDVNEGFMDAIKAGKDALAKGINKLDSSNIDLNIDDAKVAEMAKKLGDGLSYAGGKIATASKGRWELIKSWRKTFTEGGIPANLVDKAIIQYASYNTFSNPPSFDAQHQGTGSILTFDKAKNTINVKSANVSAGKKEV